MINATFDHSSLRLPATLLLVGQLLYVVVTLPTPAGKPISWMRIDAGPSNSSCSSGR